jgi:hypothetical protein
MACKQLNQLLIGFGLAVAVTVGQAAEVWSTPTQITRLYPSATVGLMFNVEWSHPLSSCDTGTRWMLDANDPNFKVMSGALMLAFAQGYPVRLHLVNDQATPECSPRVDRFFVDR